MSEAELAIKIVELFNPNMGGKWDSIMYEQKKLVLEILNQNKKDE
jgi:hypothetical protein